MNERLIQVEYEPNPRQAVFHSCGSDIAIYGGAKGGGKSCALVMEAFAYACEYPKAVIYLFRKTFDDLEANIIREWKTKVPKELYEYNEGKHCATLYNGSQVFFRYLKTKEEAYELYQGRSMDFCGIDELTQHHKETVEILLSCLRSPLGHPPRFRASCNPGGIGHFWVKKTYIIPTQYGKNTINDPVTDQTITFIPAQVYDNHILMKNDPNYVKRLENLPEAQKKAFLLGDWDVFEGMAFEEFDPRIHVVKPFIIPKHWRRWVAVDNGYTDPFSFHWFAVDEQGTVYIYREFTRDYDDPKIPYSEQAKIVKELSTHVEIVDGEEVETMEKLDFICVGHDAFSSHPLAEPGKTILTHYEEGGLNGFIRAVTDRRLRKATIHEYLKLYKDENTGEMTSKVKIFSTCKKLIEYLPLQVLDEKDAEKYAETDIDHWIDSFGYGLIAHHTGFSKKPKYESNNIILLHKKKMARDSKRPARVI